MSLDATPNKQPQARPATTRIDAAIHMFRVGRSVMRVDPPTVKFIPDTFWATQPGEGAPDINQRKRRLAKGRGRR